MDDYSDPSQDKADLAAVMHGDAREILPVFDDNTFETVITDPPYGIDFTKNERDRPRWDDSAIAFDPEFWKEISRVTKPGANILAFGHSRTFARMSVAMEDAGLTLVDTLAWIHGQGYPAGYRQLDRELRRVEAPELASTYEGWGNILRPAFEPIVMMRNLSKTESLPQAIAEGGSGGLNIRGSRIPSGNENRSRSPGRDNPATTWRVSRPEGNRSTPPVEGRHPGNVLLQHTVDCRGEVCDESCPVVQVQRQGRATRGRNENAARFYQSFLHHPKATESERPQVDGVVGPTVKPLGVMEWLVNLAARPGDLVLDPFAGTGSTLAACSKAGIRSVGIERESAYLPLISQRLERNTPSQ